LNLTNDSFNFCFYLDNTFLVFKSFDDILYFIYVNTNNSIISYNLVNNQKISEIKNPHKSYVSNFGYYADKKYKRDLLISICGGLNNIKLWNVNNWLCLLNIKNIYEYGHMYSACFLNESNQIYIITSSCKDYENENSAPIKVFDLNGNKLKEITFSNDYTYNIKSYYDYKTSKNYIVTGNFGSIKSYDFNKNKIYHIYGKNRYKHYGIEINDKEEIIKLYDSCCDGNVRIWNFHSGDLLKNIKVYDNFLYGICIWNNNYLCVGCQDKTIKLIDLKEGKVIKNLIGHEEKVINLKKVDHPKYGECLISQGWEYDQIKLWINKNNLYK